MSKNTLNQLTPEQQQTVINWIESDPDRKPGQPNAVTRVRNQFHIEATEHELQDYRFEWQLQHMLDDDNFKPENVGKLMTALSSMDQDRLQEKAFSLLLGIAMKKADNRLLLQVCKIITKNKDLDLKKTILILQLQQSAAKSKPGTANLPIDSSPLPTSPAPTSAGNFNLPIGSLSVPTPPLFNSQLPNSQTPSLSSLLAARTAEVEKAKGPQSDAAVAEIAQSILDDARKSLKRSA